MPKPATKGIRSDCPISTALDVLGDQWTLLVVRDLMFKGRNTFKDFQGAEEGIASNILADRLKRLEDHGLVSRQVDPADARRQVYRLTAAGIDLAPVLIELVLWSARHFRTGAPQEVLDEMRDHRARFLKRLRKDWENSAAGSDMVGTARRDRARR